MSDIAPEVAGAAPDQNQAQQPPAPASDAPAAAPAPAVPVAVTQPSGAAQETAGSIVEEVVEEIADIFDAAKRLVVFVEQHRTIGDGEVGNAVDAVKQAVAANEPQPVSDAPEA
jgi:hypothetical protein